MEVRCLQQQCGNFAEMLLSWQGKGNITAQCRIHMHTVQLSAQRSVDLPEETVSWRNELKDAEVSVQNATVTT